MLDRTRRTEPGLATDRRSPRIATALLVVTWGAAACGGPAPAAAASAVRSPATASETSEGTVDTPEPVDADQARRDERLRAELQATLDRIPEFSGIEVSVESGVVRLEGRALSSAVAGQAVELARSFDGVRFVVDAVEDTASLGERLRPVQRRLREFALGAVASLPLFAAALGVVLLAWLLGRVVRVVKLPSVLRARNPFLQNLIQGLLQSAVIVAGLLVALDLLGATALVGAVAGTAGLAGLAIGFAFKDIVENYLAGTLLGIRQPFAQNDHVVVSGHEGKVVRLTWRDTILMTMDGNHVRIPNGQVFGSTLLNYTRNPKRRFQFDCGIGPSDDIARAQDVGIAALAEMRSVLTDPSPRAVTLELGDSTVQVRYFAWVDQRVSDLASTRSEAIRLVKEALDAAGISLPSPEYLVQLANPVPGLAGPPAPPTTEGRDKPSVEERNTAVDHALDVQISEEREDSEEEDLLVGGPAVPESDRSP